MSYFRHGDPLEDFNRYDMEKERRLARRPVCSCCGHRIQDETAIYKDGEWTCEKCVDENRVIVEDYLDE